VTAVTPPTTARAATWHARARTEYATAVLPELAACANLAGLERSATTVIPPTMVQIAPPATAKADTIVLAASWGLAGASMLAPPPSPAMLNVHLPFSFFLSIHE